MAELIAVRPGEDLDMARLRPYLGDVFSEERSSDWQIRQYAAGHSNLTYLLTSARRSVVLRRPPLGPVAPRAHDMVRESRFLMALHGRYPWAPKVYAVCEDPQILGVPFFLMEPKTGALIDRAWAQQRGFTARDGRQISDVMVDRLAALHDVDWQHSGLKAMVKPEGFMQRQVEGWIGRYHRVKTEEMQGAEALLKFLLDHVPTPSEATVIHYDYKLNNVLFQPDLSDLAGVFDWEMATVGDPLADLAVALSYWTQAGDPDVFYQAFGEVPMTVGPGFYSRGDWVQAYAEKSGRDIHHFGYYLTFAYFKLAVIIAQIYDRFLKGQTTDARFRHFGQVTRQLLAVAMESSANEEGV